MFGKAPPEEPSHFGLQNGFSSSVLKNVWQGSFGGAGAGADELYQTCPKFRQRRNTYSIYLMKYTLFIFYKYFCWLTVFYFTLSNIKIKNLRDYCDLTHVSRCNGDFAPTFQTLRFCLFLSNRIIRLSLVLKPG